MFKKVSLLLGTALVLGLTSQGVMAFDDFNGVIESRPKGDEGAWVVGGRTIYVTDRTKLDTSDGELVEGACVEVDISQGWVTEIEADSEWRCRD